MRDIKFEKKINSVCKIFKNHENKTFDEIMELETENIMNILDCFPNGEYKIKIVKKIYDDFMSKEEEPHKLLKFYNTEDEFIKTIENNDIKAVFYSFFALHKMSMHESGWDRYTFEELCDLSGIKKLKREDIPPVLKYGIDLRVSGSKQPTLTFKIKEELLGEKTNGAEVSWSCFDDTFTNRMREKVYGNSK